MQGFLTFVAGGCLLLAFMFAIENDLNNDRLKCIEMGGDYTRISGEIYCVNKAVFIDIKGESK